MLLHKCHLILETLQHPAHFDIAVTRRHTAAVLSKAMALRKRKRSHLCATLSFLQSVADTIRASLCSAPSWQPQSLLSMTATLCEENHLCRTCSANAGCSRWVNLDSVTLFLVQWSFLAIKQLTQGNAQSQCRVQSLRAGGEQLEREMKSIGVRIVLDEKSGSSSPQRRRCACMVDGCICFGVSLISGRHHSDERHIPYADTCAVY